MEHGTHAFFFERARSARRVHAINLAVGLATLAAVLVAGIPAIRQAILRAGDDVPILRFGFEGPPRVVELVQLEPVSGGDDLRDVGEVKAATARRGGGTGGARPSPRGEPGPTKGLPSLDGLNEQDMVTRALSGESGVPLFQSDDLILDRLVRPHYPEEARAAGIEGRVGVLAHVDTLGNIIEAALLDRSGALALDRAAIEAVRQCRFRPYREEGAAKEVYAVFRFAFRIY
jgi:TonB family protein